MSPNPQKNNRGKKGGNKKEPNLYVLLTSIIIRLDQHIIKWQSELTGPSIEIT